MGFLSCPCPPPRSKEKTGHLHHSAASNHLLSSDSSNSYSLSSQPSLPSVPSLTAPPPSSVDHHCAATFKGHSSHVFALSLSGNHLFSGSHDGEIRVWPRSGSQTFNITEEKSNGVLSVNGKAAVKSLAVMGDKLLSAHQDHKIRVWKIEERQNDAAEGESSTTFRCVATIPTLEDRFLTLFSAKNYVRVGRHKTATWIHHVDTVSALAVSHDGSHLYSASWDRTVKIWRTTDFKCVESIPNAHDDAINTVVVSYDGRVYTGSADKKIKVWSKEMRKNNKVCHSLVETLEKHKSAVNALALTKDGAVLYSGACDRSVVVWEREARLGETVVVGALRGHSKAVLCLAVVGDELLCSGSADQTVRVWRRGENRSYACLAVLEGHARPVKCLSAAVDVCSDGDESYLVYSGALDCEIRVWRISVPSLSPV